jgi:hypothetical protein
MFDSSSRHLGKAERSLSAWWGAPARLVPLLSQHRAAAIRLTGGGADATTAIRNVLSHTDYDALKVKNGQIDLRAIDALQQPLADLGSAMTRLHEVADGARDPWLAAPISRWLDRLNRDLTKRQSQLTKVEQAIRVAPDMLGANGKRVYFIALTTPAEARGLGGLMGNWAEVTADHGRLKLSGFGRDRDLLQAAPVTPRLTNVSPEFLRLYGSYLIADPETGTVGPGVWQNVTASPHFPWVAEAIADLYPQSGGTQLDGVFVMDTAAISTLMQITGAVSVPQLGVTVSPESALQYLLRDQYLVKDLGNRVDLLETLARTTIDRVLAGSLPSPPKLAALMSPMARQHRLLAWARRPDEEAVFENANMDGELTPADGQDTFAYSLYNGNGNKIDAYLEGSMAYDVSTNTHANTEAGTVSITLRNTAPSSGLPDYVIGNLVGLPLGTNRTILTMYSSLTVTSVSSDNYPGSLSWSTGSERGLTTTTLELVIPPGGSVTVVANLSGPMPSADGYRLRLVLPPTAQSIPATASVNHHSLTPTAITESGTFLLER